MTPMNTNLSFLVVAASVATLAIAAPAPWYKWRSKLTGTTRCAQVMHALTMRTVYLAEQRDQSHSEAALPSMAMAATLTDYALASMVIVGSGIWLPLIGVELANIMGWSDSFVGTLFVAMATSVPELATTWKAMRIGAIDRAFGNRSEATCLTYCSWSSMIWPMSPDRCMPKFRRHAACPRLSRA